MTQNEEKKQPGGFLTQADIDNALRGADLRKDALDGGDAEALVLDESDIVAVGSEVDTDEEDLEYFGLLSKEDIEALLHGDLVSSDNKKAQEEVDSLLQAAESKKSGTGFETSEPEPDMSESADAPVSEAEAVSQEDINNLLMEASEDADVEPEPEMSESADAPVSEVEAVSQEDIDNLLMEASEDAGIEPEPEMSESADAPVSEAEAVSQDDIDKLLMEATEDSGIESEPGISESADAPVSETEAVSQDDIDQLLMNAVDDIDGEDKADAGIEPDTSNGGDAASESQDSTGSLISQEDLDQLMGEALPESNPETPPQPEPQASSEHISQDDINKILKESLEEEDEPVDEAEPDVPDEIEAQEPVILAADEDDPEPEPPIPDEEPAPTPQTNAWWKYQQNQVLMGVAAGIILFITASIAMVLSRPDEPALHTQIQTFQISIPEETTSDVPVATEKSIYFEGFIVLAPPNVYDVTYLAADLFLAFSDAKIVAVIKENEAFVRDIIYGTINSELMTRDVSAIDEISLELAIRKSLGRIVPREAIEGIDFRRFSLA